MTTLLCLYLEETLEEEIGLPLALIASFGPRRHCSDSSLSLGSRPRPDGSTSPRSTLRSLSGAWLLASRLRPRHRPYWYLHSLRRFCRARPILQPSLWSFSVLDSSRNMILYSLEARAIVSELTPGIAGRSVASF